MGKAALLFVLASSIGGATLLYTTQEADVQASAHQGEYEADVIAREIARTAFNTASADIHRYGTDIDQAIRAFGPEVSDCATGKNKCARRTGQMMGGTYVAEASYDGGNGVDVYVRGEFRYVTDRDTVVADHEINESQSVSVLRVSSGGFLRIQFIDSMAGYCSAIFLQRTLPGVAPEEQPLPEMVYAPGNGRNGQRNIGTEVYLEPGTQMNFAIGVSTNCSAPSRYPNLVWDKSRKTNKGGLSGQALLDALAAYDYRASDWNWTHWALDASTVSFSDPREGPWAMVETDPNNDQRWRIAFEDIHNWNLPPEHPDYHNPNKSLWATKEYGYDWTGSYKTKGNDGQGDGWTDTVNTVLEADDECDPLSTYRVVDYVGRDGFHDLRDTGSPADFSDQVIMVEIVPQGADGKPVENLPAHCSA